MIILLKRKEKRKTWWSLQLLTKSNNSSSSVDSEKENYHSEDTCNICIVHSLQGKNKTICITNIISKNT